MELLNLRDLLQHQVDDLYSAEEQIIDALPQMIEKATSAELKKSLNEHLKVTREHVKRLDRVKQMLGRENKDSEERTRSFLERIFGGGTKCKGMEGLITEGQKMLKEDLDPQVRDAAIIAASQKIEHYEISGYGTARAYANQLGMAEAERLLQTTLNEEYKADDLLTVLALKKVNIEAQDNVRQTRPVPKKAISAKPVSKKTVSKKAAPKKAAARKTVRKKAAR